MDRQPSESADSIASLSIFVVLAFPLVPLIAPFIVIWVLLDGASPSETN